MLLQEIIRHFRLLMYCVLTKYHSNVPADLFVYRRNINFCWVVSVWNVVGDIRQIWFQLKFYVKLIDFGHITVDRADNVNVNKVWKFQEFLSFRFYVKSFLGKLEAQNLPILEALKSDFKNFGTFWRPKMTKSTYLDVQKVPVGVLNMECTRLNTKHNSLLIKYKLHT